MQRDNGWGKETSVNHSETQSPVILTNSEVLIRQIGEGEKMITSEESGGEVHAHASL